LTRRMPGHSQHCIRSAATAQLHKPSTMPVRLASAVGYPALPPIHHLIFDVVSRCKPSFSKC
jgi:hypothetical protein